MAKELEFKSGGTNVEYLVDGDTLIIKVNLDGEDVTSKQGNPMISKGYVNFSHNDRRVFGNINLNIGKNKKALKEENELLMAEIARLKELAGEE